MNNSVVSQYLGKRKELNKKVMKYAGNKIKKFYSLDAQVYQAGALPKKTKELIGLVASTVLRCDDCITYHLIQCYDNNIKNEEIEEALAIALMIGGSITIPYIRRAFSLLDKIKQGVPKKE